ncbi:MFS transporter [Streptomyces alanosinicus]|uniref:MFS transporter n=1 Tax=Streptomyces alanosinicus TaxID=68171 RepID=A0A918YDF4_9ACTN|nr:MFS transporter [Streptomyces alanosinicus]GHD98175.1 MFS transporter [Streptomyces alanosinicus]
MGHRIDFARPRWFWCGALLCLAGVLSHLPMYAHLTHPPGHQATMPGGDSNPLDPLMLTGMAFVLAGVAACVHGIVGPRRTPGDEGPGPGPLRAGFADDVPLTRAHGALTLVMVFAVAIDVMKPMTLSFVAPGVAQEYGLRSAVHPHGGLPVALLPLSGIGGTVIGSFLWGRFGDRIGRRPAILLAGVVFLATSVCGAMPLFWMNILMCFLMGMGAGGMLPLTFTLLTETVPARQRGWIVVLVGGVGTAGGYVLTSWAAALLVPHFGWRVLWLLGLPTGVALLLLNHWIPESARFLVARGRHADAEAVLARYGGRLLPAPPPPPDTPAPSSDDGYLRLLLTPYTTLSLPLVLLALGIGLVTYGFQLWIPSDLQRLGFTELTADTTLRDAALLGLPFNLAIAWLYGRWSSKGTLVLLGACTALSMVALAALGDRITDHPLTLHLLLAVPIWSAGSAVAVLSAYTAEVYPTTVRSQASGLTAAVTKIGGILMITVVVAAVAPPSLRTTALLCAAPLALATAAMPLSGVETRARTLEEISTSARTDDASASASASA